MSSFYELADLDPALWGLLSKAISYRDKHAELDEGYCRPLVFRMDGLKEEVVRLAGWDREDRSIPELCSTEAYDEVYDMVYRAMAPCKCHHG